MLLSCKKKLYQTGSFCLVNRTFSIGLSTSLEICFFSSVMRMTALGPIAIKVTLLGER